MQAKPLTLRGKPLAARLPAICAPLVGRTRDAVLAEAAVVAAKKPDLLEWRVDFFEGIGDSAAVAALAGAIRQASGLPLLFTCRGHHEGGERVALSAAQIADLHGVVCASGHTAFVDFEMSNDDNLVRQVRESSKASGTQLVLSFHDFQKTPALEVLGEKFMRAEQLGADVAKVAVMPQTMDDVLILLSATLQASRELSIPVISMSMAGLGAMSRVCGWAFGSALSFAVGQEASAPGQMPIEELDRAISILRRATQ